MQKRAKLDKRDIERLLGGFLDPGRVVDWLIAERYRISDGCISPEPPAYASEDDVIFEQRGGTFRDPDLFMSFARLGARGEPSEESIRRWVSEHGLLTRRNDRHDELFDELNQAPITVADFRVEVLCAYQLLALYKDIRNEDVGALEARIYGNNRTRHPSSHWSHTPTTDLEKELDQLRNRSGALRRAMLRVREEALNTGKGEDYIRGIDSMMSTLDELRSEQRSALWSARRVLKKVVKDRLSGVRLSFDEVDEHVSFNLTNEHSSSQASIRDYLSEQDGMLRSWECPDLLSAMYLQFYLLITDFSPMRRCENPPCGMPLPATRTNKRFCNDTCRSNARHYP